MNFLSFFISFFIKCIWVVQS